MINVFKDFTLKWWQASVFKLSLVSFGLLVGSAWPGVFEAWRNALVALFLVTAVYLTRVWWKQ